MNTGNIAISPLKSSLSIVVVIVCWAVATDICDLTERSIVPSPSLVFWRLGENYAVWSVDLSATVLRWVSGFMIGAVLGGVWGVLVGWSNVLMNWSMGIFEMFRAIPVTAVFPLILLLVGIGDEAKIVMAAYPTFFITALNTCHGMRATSLQRRLMAHSFGASRRQVFWHIALPEALPGYFVGLRVSLSLSLAVAVVAEMFIGTETGVGQKVYESYLMSDAGSLYAFLILLGAIGWGSSYLFSRIESKLLPWVAR